LDPDRFDDPAGVDLARSSARSHLPFNHGFRACIGAALAGADLREAVRSVASYFPSLEFHDWREPPSFRGFINRSFRPLHVILGHSAATSTEVKA
jgi:cytochrome P450